MVFDRGLVSWNSGYAYFVVGPRKNSTFGPRHPECRHHRCSLHHSRNPLESLPKYERFEPLGAANPADG